MLLLALVAALLLSAPATAGDRRRPSGIASADARLRVGATTTPLRAHGLGRWTATGSKDGRVGVAFVADRLLPTPDLVVSRAALPPVTTRFAGAMRPRATIALVSPGDAGTRVPEGAAGRG